MWIKQGNKMLHAVVFILFAFIRFVISAPVDSTGKIAGALKERKSAANYFLKYGYLEDFESSADETVFAESLKSFQKFVGLNVTGKLDEDTKKQFEIPRCGLRDPISKVTKRKRRYVLQGGSWDLNSKKDRTLTWRLENRGRTLGKETIRTQLDKAFSIWQKHANIFFKETAAQDADIIVKFANGCHSDPYCFDYRGGTLAHAFYPFPGQAISGDVHFDNDENYVVGGRPGTDLLWVAVHEIGHSLGLDHTNIRGAIMFPYYQGYKKDFDLQDDDAAGIQELYGAAIQKIPTTLPPTTTTAKPTTLPLTTTTEKPTTLPPTTTTEKPTTLPPTTTTEKPTTLPLTTTTEKPTTLPPTTTTEKPTTLPPTTTTEKPTTLPLTTTTEKPTTLPPTTTTEKPTTLPPTTTTEKPTTLPPTTTTEKPTTLPPKTTTEKPATTLRQTPKPTQSSGHEFICPKYVDAAYISLRYRWMIVVAGRWLYLANRNGIRHGPLVQRNYFPRIKGMIDSTLMNKLTGETIIFSGKYFYIYREFSHRAGPFPLTDLGFGQEINKIDGAMQWKRNKQFYVFANDQFWRFNPIRPGIIKEGYPKRISEWWKGVPGYLSSIVTDFDDITRFTKGEQYYTLKDRAVKVEKDYPERIGVGWMQCRVTKPVPKDQVQDDEGKLGPEP